MVVTREHPVYRSPDTISPRLLLAADLKTHSSERERRSGIYSFILHCEEKRRSKRRMVAFYEIERNLRRCSRRSESVELRIRAEETPRAVCSHAMGDFKKTKKKYAFFVLAISSRSAIYLDRGEAPPAYNVGLFLTSFRECESRENRAKARDRVESSGGGRGIGFSRKCANIDTVRGVSSI